ncbi:MAG: response regulator [Spartobacteria bacterium]|nr:response regulator [Spartobacteria bacterium]
MKEELSQPEFLSVPRAAKLCGVTRNTVYTWVKNGKLKAYQTPGRTNLIRPADLVAFMREHGMFVTPPLAELAQMDEKQHATLSGANPETDKPALLVVDDEPSMRALVTRCLKGFCPLYQAETAYEALHLLTMHPNIKVVLLDLRMPGKHGLEAQQEIIGLRPDVSVAIITGHFDEYAKEILIHSDVERVFKKPFNLEELQAFVQEKLTLYNA